MKLLYSCLIAVTLLALAAQGDTPVAADGRPPAINPAPPKPVAAKPAAENPPAAISERERWKQIQKAWRRREERVPSLLLVYVMNTKDEQLRDRQRAAQARHNQQAVRVGDAAKKDPHAPKNAAPAGPAKLSSVHLFAVRQNRLRSEYWQRPSEKEARALLAGLTPGKDSDYAVIEEGNLTCGLTPNSHDTAGSRFRQVGIGPRANQIANTTIGTLLLLNYRSSLVAPSVRFPLEAARLTVVPQKGDQPPRVIASFPRCDIWLDPSRDYLVTEILTCRADRSSDITRTVCEYEKAPAPLDWVPKRFTSTWLPGSALGNRVDDCVTFDWATGDDKVPNELFEFEYSDGTMILDQTEDNGQTTKASIVWKGKLAPASMFRTYAESLARIKKGQPAVPDGKK